MFKANLGYMKLCLENKTKQELGEMAQGSRATLVQIPSALFKSQEWPHAPVVAWRERSHLGLAGQPSQLQFQCETPFQGNTGSGRWGHLMSTSGSAHVVTDVSVHTREHIQHTPNAYTICHTYVGVGVGLFERWKINKNMVNFEEKL